MPVLTYSNPERYHPHRALNAWRTLEEHCENSDREFDHYFSTAASIISEWAEGRNMTPQDAAMIEDEGWIECLLEDRIGKLADRTFILDARSILADVQTEGVDASIFDVFPRSSSGDLEASYYVHFGRNAFPSPFPGAGVEGAYVQVAINPERQSGMDVAVTLACSDPYLGVVGSNEHRSAGLCLIDAVRSITLHLNPEDSEHYGWDTNVKYYEKEPSADAPNDTQWVEFVRQPMNAALWIMQMHFSKRVEFIPAVPKGTAKSVASLIANSTSDEQWADFSPSVKGFAVRYLGTVPPESQNGPAAIRPVEISELHVDAMVDDAYEMDTAELGVRVAMRAADLAQALEVDGHGASRARMRATAAVVELALAADDTVVSVAAANRLAESQSKAAEALLPLAWLAYTFAEGQEDHAAELRIRCAQIGPQYEELLANAENVVAYLTEENHEGVLGHFMEHPAHVSFHVDALNHMARGTTFDSSFAEEWHNTMWTGFYPDMDDALTDEHGFKP